MLRLVTWDFLKHVGDELVSQSLASLDEHCNDDRFLSWFLGPLDVIEFKTINCYLKNRNANHLDG